MSSVAPDCQRIVSVAGVIPSATTPMTSPSTPVSRAHSTCVRNRPRTRGSIAGPRLCAGPSLSAAGRTSRRMAAGYPASAVHPSGPAPPARETRRRAPGRAGLNSWTVSTQTLLDPRSAFPAPVRRARRPARSRPGLGDEPEARPRREQLPRARGRLDGPQGAGHRRRLRHRPGRRDRLRPRGRRRRPELPARASRPTPRRSPRWSSEAGRKAVLAPADLTDEAAARELVAHRRRASSAASTSSSTSPASSRPSRTSPTSPPSSSTRRSRPTSTRCSGSSRRRCRTCRRARRSSPPPRSRPTRPRPAWSTTPPPRGRSTRSARRWPSSWRPRASASTWSPRARSGPRCRPPAASRPRRCREFGEETPLGRAGSAGRDGARPTSTWPRPSRATSSARPSTSTAGCPPRELGSDPPQAGSTHRGTSRPSGTSSRECGKAAKRPTFQTNQSCSGTLACSPICTSDIAPSKHPTTALSSSTCSPSPACIRTMSVSLPISPE